MRHYRIHNRTSGQVLGIFDAPSPQAALDALARDAGYRDAAHATEVAGTADLCVTEVDDPTDRGGALES